MYQSGKSLSNQGLTWLVADLKQFLSQQKKIRSRALGRYVSLEKLPEAITSRKDAKRRLQAIHPALDIVRHAPSFTTKVIRGNMCVEFRGKDANGNLIIVHLREEVAHKDRIVFFISCATK